MTESSRFWTGTTTGDAGPYSAAQFADFARFIAGYGGEGAAAYHDGILLGSGDGNFAPLWVMQDSPASANVRLAIGRAAVLGYEYINDAIKLFAVAANSSGQPRIDTLVLRVDFVAQTVRAVLKQGTPAGSPTRPALTQSAGVTWEIPLADVAVANAFVSIVDANITNYPLPSNLHSVVAHDSILNTQGAELITGDVVIWDTASGSRAAKKTTTANDSRVAGVWTGLTPASALGRLVYGGLAWVKVSAATALNSPLVTSATAGQARPAASGEKNVFGYALSSTAGAGVVLASINPFPFPSNVNSGVSASRVATQAMSGSFQDVTWDTEQYDTDNYITVSSATFTFPITGRYLITGQLTSAGATNSALEVRPQVNGSTQFTILESSTVAQVSAPIMLIVNVNAGDTFKVQARNQGSPTGTITGNLQIELMTK